MTALDHDLLATVSEDAPGRDGSVMRLVFVIAGLTGGGAERVLSVLANESADRGHHVTVVTLDPAAPDFYPLRPAIRRIHLDVDPGSTGMLHRVSIELHLLLALRAELRRQKPDGVISFSTETNGRVLLASMGLRCRVVVSERSDPASMPLRWVWATLRRTLYRTAHAVVLQTEDARRWIVDNTGARRTVVIPNPAPIAEESADEARALPQPLMLAMGRLRPEKGIDMLLDAFARTREAHPEWHLGIIGDGPEREMLERRVADLALGDAVTFAGLLERPTATLRQAQLFVLSSRFEGFPNALVEAMSLGLPAIAFDCPSGPRSIIHHEVDGLLVPAAQVEALAAAISRLMGDSAARARLGAAARDVTSRFAVDRVVTQWLAALRLSSNTEVAEGRLVNSRAS